MYYANESNGFDLKDEFTFCDLSLVDYILPENNSAVDEKKVMQDLQRVFVVIHNHGKPYVICKQIDYTNPYNILEFIRFSTFKNHLKDTNIKGKLSLFSVYNNYSDLLLTEGLIFNEDIPGYFKYFQGYYTRNILQEVSLDRIRIFLDYIQEMMADDNLELYNYLFNWISFIVQNPGQRTRKALVFTGRDWECKRIVPKILCRMIEPYAKEYQLDNINGC